jgi:DNA repair protein RadD
VTLVLRPYQREAVDAIGKYFSENDGNCLITIPTAGGKSLIIATFVREAIEAWPDTRILILTHVRELITQNYAEMLGVWPDAPAGIHSAGLGRRDVRSQIIFGGIQSIHGKAYDLQRVDLVLVDEAHLIPRAADTRYMKFIGELRQINPYIKVVGFTATPFRLDSGRLDQGEDAMFDGTAYEANIRDLIREGFLSPPISKTAQAQVDTTGVGTRGGEFIPGQLEAAALDPETIEAVADEIVAHGEDRKGWLVFGCGIKHSTAMAEALVRRGITCETIFGDTTGPERDDIIARFKRREIQSLSSMGVLTTGFNAKHVDLIALVRPTKSTGLYIQIVGRGTRLDEGKENCLVLDFGGNIARHGPVDRPFVKPPGTGNGEGTVPMKICPECGAPNLIAARECLTCGAEFEMQGSQVSTRAATMEILSRTKTPEWLDVTDIRYRRHTKPGKPDSLCVSYYTGLLAHREWICFEHTGYAREKAVSWWKKRAPATQVPNTVTEALTAYQALAVAKKILVRENGKFTEIVGVSFA